MSTVTKGSTRKRLWSYLAACAVALAAPLVAVQPAAAGPPPTAWIGGGQIGVLAEAVSPDQQTIAVAGGDNTVKLWGVGSRRLIRTLAGHIGGVSAVAFTPDGQYLVSGGEFVFGSSDSPLKLWRVADGSLVREFKVPADAVDVRSVAVSPDGTLVAAGHSRNQVNLYRIADGGLVRSLLGHTDQVLSVAFSPDGRRIASGSTDNTVRVWQVLDGVPLRVLSGHTSFVTAVAFSPDGSTLASGSNDTTVRLWRASDLTPIRTLRHTDTVNSVAFSADSRTLASGGGDVDVRLWDPATGTLLRTLSGSAKDLTSSVAFIASGISTLPDMVAVGGFGGHVRFWQTSTGTFAGSLGEHTGPVMATAFSPDGKLLATTSGDLTAKLWNTADGTVARTLEGHTDVVDAVAFSPDGSLLATAANTAADSTIRIWRTATGAPVVTLPGHVLAGTTGVAFSRDGQTVISSGLDGSLRFWRVTDGTLLRAVRTGVASRALAISPDRATVAVEGSGHTVRFYSAVDGTLLRSTPSVGNVASLSFSGDGSLLAAGVGNDVAVVRVANASVLRTLSDPRTINVQSVAFAPTGATLASGSGFTHTIQLWDAATGTLRTTYDQETGWGPFPELPVAFSPDGFSLGYGRGDATVVLARLVLTATAAAASAVAPCYGDCQPGVVRSNGVVRYDAPVGVDDQITVSVSGGVVTVSDPPATMTAGPGCTLVTPHVAQCATPGSATMTVRGLDGNDVITNNTGYAARLAGGDGADRLVGGTGDDILTGGFGADVLQGGAGSDTVSYSETGARVGVRADLDGATGDDGSADDGPVGARDTIAADVENLEGTIAADVLIGNAGPNAITASGGSDQIQGLGGDDQLTGRGGGTVNGGAGTDRCTSDLRGLPTPADAFAGCETTEILT